jgi:hypothetical protein
MNARLGAYDGLALARVVVPHVGDDLRAAWLVERHERRLVAHLIDTEITPGEVANEPTPMSPAIARVWPWRDAT